MQSVMAQEDSNFIRHDACPDCGSKDALGIYDDSHTFCFSCLKHTQNAEPCAEGVETTSNPAQDTHKAVKENLLQGETKALPARLLTEETCRKFGYICTEYRGEAVQAATYRDAKGRPVAQKIRTKDKKFSILGDAKAMTLFGSHLWSKGKKLVITEGEIDCMSVSQVQSHKWATVGLTHGAPSAVKTIKANWDYINNFDQIILMFDMDEVGQKAAQDVAEILPVGKCLTASLPYKDANECLQEGKGHEIVSAIFQAKEYRPDGIVTPDEYRDVITEDEQTSAITYPYSMLNEVLKGIRLKELVVISAGSGVGKSTLVKELIYHLMQSGQKVGAIMLEESEKRTLLGLLGIHMNKNILVDRSLATDEEVLAGFDDLYGNQEQNLYLYRHWGSTEVDLICQKMVFMAKSLNVKWIVLDHLAILISQNALATDERKLIDYAMTKMRTLVQEHDIGMILVSHLRRPDGNRGHEAGGTVRLSDLRSSHSIAQLSDACIGMQVDPEDPDGDFRHLVVLKNRFTGQTGPAGTVVYDRETGRLLEESLAALQPNNNEEGDAHADGSV